MSDLYELTDIEFGYNREPMLSFHSLSISGKDITAVVGPNGSGKTTLLNILAFVYKPRHGRIRFNGEDVAPDDYPQLRRRVGYVQQKPYLFHSSVRRNIETGLKIRGINRQDRRVASESIIHEFGLERLAGRYAHDLSGGEAQKVAIARAMVLKPEVLILDEPFSHLDRSFRRELEDMLNRIHERGEAKIIFTTHDQVRAQSFARQTISLFAGHPVPMAVVNLFSGRCDGKIFDTGRIRILLPDEGAAEQHLAIDSSHLVISRRKLESSMRNRFQGRISGLSEDNGHINVTIQSDEIFHATITPAALQELGVNIGDEVWVSFKSSAVHVF